MAGKKKAKIRTERPDAADPAPVHCYRFGAGVVLRLNTPNPAFLSAAEALELAVILNLQGGLARRTPRTGCGGKGGGQTFQLPDE